MIINRHFDVAIVGGGLAGLSAAICLAKTGHSVALTEKEAYPFHKVCGEYVSMESWGFLQSAGLPLNSMNLPRISELMLTSASGKYLKTKLPLGGFGISRYLLDTSLAAIATSAGTTVITNTKVQDVDAGKIYKLHLNSLHQGNYELTSNICCGAFGKKSNLDVKWKRDFIQNRNNEFVAVKYHVDAEWPDDTIGLHNFRGGYCGISAIERNKFCLCYLVKTSVFKECENNIQLLEKTTLSRNPFLKKILSSYTVLDSFPVVISQVTFQKKPAVENGMLMMGDAAGMLAPLAGNGMSMAMHTGKMGAQLIDLRLSNKISQQQMEQQYEMFWKKNFSSRFDISKAIQRFFGKEMASELFIEFFKIFPALTNPVIRLTHGKPF